MARDFYNILGVKRDASDDDIRRAYRKLARQFHPDRNPGDKQAEAKFKEVQEAYDILSDKSKRTQYDRFGEAGLGAGFQQAPGGPGGFQFRWGGGPGGFQQMDGEEAADIFRQFFGGGGSAFGAEEIFGRQPRGGRGRARPTPHEIETEVTIPFAIAANGGKVDLQFDGRQLTVKIPAGVEDGKVLRLQGQAPGGGLPGQDAATSVP